MDISKLTIKDINSIKFSRIDPIDYPETEKSSFRIKSSDMYNMPDTDENKQAELRIKIIELFEEKLGGQTTKVEEYCDINRTLFSKYLHSKARLSKTSLIKFIIGLKLGNDLGQELLILNGTPIDWDCRFDFIASCAIRDMDELEDFYDYLEEYGCKPISGI